MYVARYTITPELDQELNYSCYFGGEDTLQHALDFVAPYAIHEQYWTLLRSEAINSQAVDYREYGYSDAAYAEEAANDLENALVEAGWLSSEEIAQLKQRAEVAAAEEHDIVFDPRGGQWRQVHHGGLSCWALESDDLQSAIEEARKLHDEAKIEWGGFGYQTHGTVKAIAKVTTLEEGELWLFECESVSHEC
jgi:hypothetical protein